MAVDTAQRRLASLSFGQIYIIGLVPDGTIDVSDRQAIAFSYNGIASDAPIPFVPRPSGMLAAQNVRRSMRRYRGGRR